MKSYIEQRIYDILLAECRESPCIFTQAGDEQDRVRCSDLAGKIAVIVGLQEQTRPEPDEGCYIIQLRCTNCKHIWWQSIPKEKEYFSRAFKQASGYGSNSYGAYKNKVNCPNCECNTVRSGNWTR